MSAAESKPTTCSRKAARANGFAAFGPAEVVYFRKFSYKVKLVDKILSTCLLYRVADDDRQGAVKVWQFQVSIPWTYLRTTKWLIFMRKPARAGRFAASPKIYLLSRVPSIDSKNRGVCFAKLLQWVFRQLWRSCSSFARLWGRDQHQVCSVSEENTRLSHELTYV